MSSQSPASPLFQVFTKEEVKAALNSMYDAFIRDEVSGNYKHEERVLVHDVYRAIEAFLEETPN